jgi:hypothetical protein
MRSEISLMKFQKELSAITDFDSEKALPVESKEEAMRKLAAMRLAGWRSDE